MTKEESNERKIMKLLLKVTKHLCVYVELCSQKENIENLDFLFSSL
jgi:hypothetical protein